MAENTELDQTHLILQEINRQRLRQLARQANKEKQLNKPPKAYREIFQYLKELM